MNRKRFLFLLSGLPLIGSCFAPKLRKPDFVSDISGVPKLRRWHLDEKTRIVSDEREGWFRHDWKGVMRHPAGFDANVWYVTPISELEAKLLILS